MGNSYDIQELSDEVLIARLRERGREDERLFTEVFHRYRQLVWGVCSRYFHQPEDIADMTQDVFLRVYRRVDDFTGGHPGSFPAWLVRITANLAKNELRRRSRRPQAIDKEPDPATADDEVTVIQNLQKRCEIEQLHRALASLSSSQREILELADLHELPYSQIAGELGLSLSAVKMRTVRARAALAAAYRAVETKEPSL